MTPFPLTIHGNVLTSGEKVQPQVAGRPARLSVHVLGVINHSGPSKDIRRPVKSGRENEKPSRVSKRSVHTKTWYGLASVEVDYWKVAVGQRVKSSRLLAYLPVGEHPRPNRDFSTSNLLHCGRLCL